MATAVRVQLVTPRGTVFDGSARSLVVRSEIGEMCILPGHCAMLAAIVPSRMIVEIEDGHRLELLVDRGFLEGGAEQVRVVVERCTDIDKLEATALRSRIDELDKQLSHLADEAPGRDALVRELTYHRAGLQLLDPHH